MRKLVDTGVRIQKALAGGDGELFYPKGNYEDDSDYSPPPSGGPMPVETKAPGSQMLKGGPSGSGMPGFAGTNEIGAHIAAGLNKLLSGQTIPVSPKKDNKNSFGNLV